MVANNKKSMTIDDLALMVAKGFENTASKDGLQKIEQRMEGLEGRMGKLENKMGRLESEMEGLHSSVNNYLKLSDERYLELKGRQTVIVSWIQKIAKKTGVQIDLKELEQKI